MKALEAEPNLIRYWDKKKNAGISLSSIAYHTKQSYWWVCEQSHEYRQKPDYVIKYGCPVCHNRQLLTGYNDVASHDPDVVADWDDAKDPSKVRCNDSRKVHWKCHDCGHEWDASPTTVAFAGMGADRAH